jgi:hypothetical protein
LIVKELEKESVKNVAIRRNMPERTVYGILKNKFKIEKAFNSQKINVNKKRFRTGKYKDLFNKIWL